MKRMKWTRIGIFATCYLVCMLIAPFIIGKKITNWLTWTVMWAAIAILVAIIWESLRVRLRKDDRGSMV